MVDEAMKTAFEIPNEMRDFAERSVEQARRAVETFLGAAQKAATTVESSSSALQTNARDMTQRASSLAERNMTATFDMLQKLTHARGMDEVMKIQSEFMQSQMQEMQQHASAFGASMQQAAKGTTSQG